MLAEDRAQALTPEATDKPKAGRRSRDMLARRVTDVVCLPSSEISPQERQLAGDLLVDILLEGDVSIRKRCARRLAALTEPPHRILRLLGQDAFEIAQPILENCDALNDADLVEIARNTTQEHRIAIAGREDVGELVVQALLETHELPVVRKLLKNSDARFYYRTMDRVVALSRDHDGLVELILPRPELRPSQALAMYWWSGREVRKQILTRFAASRRLLQEAAADVFPVAAGEGWSDALSRKSLQFIDRRQRNRKAIEHSPYSSLEDACRHAARGLTRELVQEISYLSGIKPATGAQIFTDQGGEPLAVLCKATGLKRESLEALWRGLKRPGDLAAPGEHFETVLECYDMLANEKAQTVLRYWNWALTSAVSPAVLDAMSKGTAEMDEDEPGVARRTAQLVFGR